jgi:hypothetical protein
MSLSFFLNFFFVLFDEDDVILMLMLGATGGFGDAS